MDLEYKNLQDFLSTNTKFDVAFDTGKDLNQRLTGKFYTPEQIGIHLVFDLINSKIKDITELKIIDPFCGDGRLIEWLLIAMKEKNILNKKKIFISLWDCDKDAIKIAKKRILSQNICKSIEIDTKIVDTFSESLKHKNLYDICITNPPWETLKPDNREIISLCDKDKENYIQSLKNTSVFLENNFPYSKATRKFSGWGTNLARCGIESAIGLVNENGIFGIVSPATIFGDQISKSLRTWLFEQHTIINFRYFPAEAKLFKNVDQAVTTFVGKKQKTNDRKIKIMLHSKDSKCDFNQNLSINKDYLSSVDYSIGFNMNQKVLELMSSLTELPKLADYESDELNGIKFGRELDETGIGKKLTKRGKLQFIKGRDIKKYSLQISEVNYLKNDVKVVSSANFPRLIWRDVARQTSSRRMIATIINKGYITGNSLNIAYIHGGNEHFLKAMLGVFNSIIFEAQIRSTISTNHLSVGAIKKLRVPNFSDKKNISKLSKLVTKQLKTPSSKNLMEIEIFIADWYGLKIDSFLNIINFIDKNNEMVELKKYVLNKVSIENNSNLPEIIPNHYASNLSDLDILICQSVPPSGNWKDIPEHVPSNRIANIRKSCAAGEGSRSTYYGRLNPDKPSYTINTYFTRPGNGCHIHYDAMQNRTISQREAARLQTFPDNFKFYGSKTSICNQIGNAVPPLLAYQIAGRIPFKGQFIDLFSGAGGLSLGFIWKGWSPLIANEIDESFSVTYSKNIHNQIIVGDIRNKINQDNLIKSAKNMKKNALPLFVLGGPPCQGFSTAGNRRSMLDDRNWLFRDYCQILSKLKPDGFIFENVTGILNMEGGKIFDIIQNELAKYAKNLFVWKISSENYAIPQRRTRIIIIGDNTGLIPQSAPKILTTIDSSINLSKNILRPPSAKEALDDLPVLIPGEDGSNKSYKHEPLTIFQKLMRGIIDPENYLSKFTQ